MAWLELSVEELAAWRQAGKAHTLLDVREPWEISTASMGADQMVPMAEIPGACAVLSQLPQPLVVLCHAGVRSARVAAFLSQQGFTQVYSLAGGIDAWSCRVDPSVPRY
ncbi:MAG: sulfurtransferase [Planctomycetota bacterium]|nr:MAG: sulfurtransferase [Planctomycetota bacterium]